MIAISPTSGRRMVISSGARRSGRSGDEWPQHAVGGIVSMDLAATGASGTKYGAMECFLVGGEGFSYIYSTLPVAEQNPPVNQPTGLDFNFNVRPTLLFKGTGDESHDWLLAH